jgi:hypothetical protein
MVLLLFRTEGSMATSLSEFPGLLIGLPTDFYWIRISRVIVQHRLIRRNQFNALGNLIPYF